MQLIDRIHRYAHSGERLRARWIARLASIAIVAGITTLFMGPWLPFLMFGGPVIPVIVAYLLVSYVGARKPVLLYLRRFGLKPAIQMVSSALDSGLSRRYRVVTLDGEDFAALGAPTWARRVSRYGPTALAITVVIAFVIVVRVLRQAWFENLVRLWISAASVPLIIVNVWLLLTLLFLLLFHLSQIRARARGRISTHEDLQRQSRQIVSLSSRIHSPAFMAPQATVIKVDDGLWQSTVQQLARHSGAVLIDVSQPTQNLLWELEQTLSSHSDRTILVADRTLVAEWYARAVDPATIEARVAALLEQCVVLTYDAQSRRGLRPFRRSLMRALDGLARIPSPEPASPKPWSADRVVRRVRSASAYAMIPVISAVLVLGAARLSGQWLADLFLRERSPVDRTIPIDTLLRMRGISKTTQALQQAARHGDSVTVDLLIEAGVRPDGDSLSEWKPLLLAASAGHAAAVRLLIESGARIDVRTLDRRTALVLATAGGHAETVDVLLNAGASPNPDSGEWNALMAALVAGKDSIAEALIARGADVNAQSSGMNALMLAAALRRGRVMVRLLAAGATPNLRNWNGRTALILAAIEGCLTCVEALLSAGADAAVIDRFGRTALDYATLNRHSHIVDALGTQPMAEPAPSSQSPQRSGRALLQVNVLMTAATRADLAALASALTRMLAETKNGGPYRSQESLLFSADDRTGTRRIGFNGFELSTARYHYAIRFAAEDTYAPALLQSAGIIDGVVAVASPSDTAGRTLARQLQWASSVGVPAVIVAANDASHAEAVHERVRGLGYAAIPVAIVSAEEALAGTTEALAPVRQLLDEMDRAIQPAVRLRDQPFLMTIENEWTGRDSIRWIAGRIERGTVQEGDTLDIVGFQETRPIAVAGIEIMRKRLDRAEAGDRVALVLRETSDEVLRGQVFAARASIQALSRMTALVYLFRPDQDGRFKPVTSGYRPEFYVRTTDITGVVRLLSGSSSMDPGGTAFWEIELVSPVAIERGLQFVVREGGRSVGIGVVTSNP